MVTIREDRAMSDMVLLVSLCTVLQSKRTLVCYFSNSDEKTLYSIIWRSFQPQVLNHMLHDTSNYLRLRVSQLLEFSELKILVKNEHA